MKKGTGGASKVALAAVAAASALAAENADLWARPGWIKDILSKSGTEIKEVPAEGNSTAYDEIVVFAHCGAQQSGPQATAGDRPGERRKTG